MDDKIVITCQVKTTGKTGVEMEALTGVSVSAMTIYGYVQVSQQKI
jgi:cyclic pyranopterin phosphate synthase